MNNFSFRINEDLFSFDIYDVQRNEFTVFKFKDGGYPDGIGRIRFSLSADRFEGRFITYISCSLVRGEHSKEVAAYTMPIFSLNIADREEISYLERFAAQKVMEKYCALYQNELSTEWKVNSQCQDTIIISESNKK